MISQLIEMAKRLGVPEEELRQLSKEMGSDNGAIPPAIGSVQMTSLASDLIDARGERPDPDGMVAEEAYEQRMAEKGALTEMQKAQVDASTFDANLHVEELSSPNRNRYATLGRRVRSLRS